MKIFNEKIKQVAATAHDLIEKILRWRSIEVQRLLHVKYEPDKSGAQSHFDAIMADVNAERKKVEEFLKIQHVAENLNSEMANIDILSQIDISDEELADIEYKKKLKKQREMQMFLKKKPKR